MQIMYSAWKVLKSIIRFDSKRVCFRMNCKCRYMYTFYDLSKSNIYDQFRCIARSISNLLQNRSHCIRITTYKTDIFYRFLQVTLQLWLNAYIFFFLNHATHIEIKIILPGISYPDHYLPRYRICKCSNVITRSKLKISIFSQGFIRETISFSTSYFSFSRN